MPLSLSNRDQNSGHLFYNRRLRAATTRFSARMKHDYRKQTAAIALSMVLVAIGAGWMMFLNVLKPTGVVGDSATIGDRDSGAIYARIDGRLYPALNLTSARLATGTAGQPTWVKPAEVAKYPTGPLVGIPGAPAAMPSSPHRLAPASPAAPPPAVTAVTAGSAATSSSSALPGIPVPAAPESCVRAGERKSAPRRPPGPGPASWLCAPPTSWPSGAAAPRRWLATPPSG